MNPPLISRLAVVLYAGNHSEWEPVLHEAAANFGRAKNRIYIVGSKLNPAPDSLLNLAEAAFEEVFHILTQHDSPRGFGQKSVYEVAAKIMETPTVAHRGPLLWLGRPIHIHRSTWLDEVEREYVSARQAQQTLFMSSLFVIPGGAGVNTSVPISAFLTPHDWSASPHAANLRKLPQITPLSEEPINYALRDELTRPSVFKATSLFGAADLGINPVWAFSVRKVDQPVGPKRVTDTKGGMKYDLPSLIQWLETSGTRGVDTNIFGRTVFDAVRQGILRVAWASAFSNDNRSEATGAPSEVTVNREEAKPAGAPVLPIKTVEDIGLLDLTGMAIGTGAGVSELPPPPFLEPVKAEDEQPAPEPPRPQAPAPEILPDGALVYSAPNPNGLPGLALLPPRPPSGEAPVTDRVVTIGVPGVATATPNPAPPAMKLQRPAAQPPKVKPPGRRAVVTA